MRHLLVIPVFNEEETLPVILKKIELIQQKSDQFDLLCINDGSTDRSSQILQTLPATIHHPFNKGYGYTMREALRYGKEQGYTHVTTMDCDHQHDPDDLLRFFTMKPEVEVLSGSRYLPQCRIIGHAPEERMEINRRVVRALQRRHGLKLTDAFCGFKRYALQNLDPLVFTEDGYSFPLEFWVYAAAKGLSIEEIPVDRIYTDAARSFGLNLDLQRKRFQYYLETMRRAEHRFLSARPSRQALSAKNASMIR